MPYRIASAIVSISILLSLFNQLEASATHASAQAADFAAQMDAAIPCATQARPLEECASFNDASDELDAYAALLETTRTDLQGRLPDTNPPRQPSPRQQQRR